MNTSAGLHLGLGSLPLLSEARTRSVSPENPTGAKGMGGTAYIGNTLKHPGENGPPKWSLYRWHIMDPIRFQRDLRVTIQALGWWPNGRYQPLADDIASVAYWYQEEPHAAFPPFPPLERRWPR